MTPAQIDTAITWGFRALLALIFIGAMFYAFGSLKHLLVAPLETELSVSRATNAGMKASGDHQNAAVDGLATAGKAKQEKSRQAVAGAGKAELERAGRILAAPPVGETDADRARNRIDRELGLQ